jgi:hypothetical protein
VIFSLSTRVGTHQSFIQHCLIVISDHYYVMYFLIPLYLLICFFMMEDDSHVVIARYGSYSRYFWSKWLSLVVITVWVMLIQLAGITVTGIGLPLDGGWGFTQDVTEELFVALMGVFPSPGLCFLAVVGFMCAGLALVGMICLWMGHFLSRSWAVRVLIGVFVLSLLGMRIEVIRGLPLTLVNHLVILHHNLSWARLVITLATSIVLIAVIAWTVRKHWQQHVGFTRRRVRGLTPYYCRELVSVKNLLILAGVVGILVGWKYAQSGGGMTGEQWVMRLFAGHGTGGFHVLSFIEMLVMNGAPLYLLAVFIERVATSHSIYVTVRLKKRSVILKGILSSAGVLLVVYGAMLIVVPSLGMAIAGITPDGNLVGLLGISAGLRVLDISVQFLAMMVIYCVTGQITAGFGVLVGVNLLCMVPVVSRYLPFGLASLSRVNLPEWGLDGLVVPMVIGILVTTSGVFLGWLSRAGYQLLPRN